MARFTAPEFAWLAARVEEVLWIPEKDYVPVARRVLPTKKEIDDGFKKLAELWKKPKKRKPPGPTVPSQDNPMTVEQYNKWRAGMMAGSHGYRHTLKHPAPRDDVPPYVYQEYPRVLYRNGQTCVVKEATSHNQKLKAGWAETPDKPRQKVPPK